MNYSASTKLKDCVNSSSDLLGFLSYKSKHHHSYKWYLKYEYAKNMLDTGSFYISDGNGWNDPNDRLSQINYKLYGLCLSFSTSENVAMWMLYAEKSLNGAMFDFSQSQITLLRNVSQIYLCDYDEDNKKYIKKQKLVKEDDFYVESSDVLYCDKQHDGYFTIKRSDYRCADVEEETINSINEYQRKEYAWNYENEIRLIFKIKKSSILKEAENCKFIKVEMDDIGIRVNEIKKVCAPNFMGSTPSGFAKSNLKISWDLCKKCKEKGN